MLKGFLKACRPPKESNEIKCNKTYPAYEPELVCAQMNVDHIIRGTAISILYHSASTPRPVYLVIIIKKLIIINILFILLFFNLLHFHNSFLWKVCFVFLYFHNVPLYLYKKKLFLPLLILGVFRVTSYSYHLTIPANTYPCKHSYKPRCT